MICERSIRETAEYIKRETYDPSNYPPPILIRRAEITFPYQEIEIADYNACIPDVAWKSYEVAADLFDPDKIPGHWADFISEVAKIRAEVSNSTRINIVSAIHFVILDNAGVAEDLGIRPFEISPETGREDLRDQERVFGTIDTVIRHPILRQELLRQLTYLIPDVSPFEPEDEQIVDLAQKLSPNSALIIDFGCGTGRRTIDFAEKTKRKTIGVDRQYHSPWYDGAWQGKKDGLAYVRADLIRGIPFPDDSVDLGIMEFVIHDSAISAIALMLSEITRVLKSDTGVLAVYPFSAEYDKNFNRTEGMWRFFAKSRDRDMVGLERKPFKSIIGANEIYSGT